MYRVLSGCISVVDTWVCVSILAIGVGVGVGVRVVGAGTVLWKALDSVLGGFCRRVKRTICPARGVASSMGVCE